MSFMEIFQPGLKYLREERERQRMNVAHPTDGADPLMEIDLDAGTATIVITTPDGSPGTDSPPHALAEADADDPAGAADLAIVGQPRRRRTSARKLMDQPASRRPIDRTLSPSASLVRVRTSTLLRRATVTPATGTCGGESEPIPVTAPPPSRHEQQRPPGAAAPGIARWSRPSR